MSRPSAVWSDAAQAYLPPDPKDFPEEQAHLQVVPPGAPPPQQAVAPAPPSRSHDVYREQLKMLGGIECPHCQEVFIPQKVQGTVVPETPEPAVEVPTKVQTQQLVETDEPIPEPVVDDPEDAVEGTHMPGSTTELEFQKDAPVRTPAQKLKILLEWEHAENDDHRTEVLMKYGINRQHIGSWRGMHRRGKLAPPQDKL